MGSDFEMLRLDIDFRYCAAGEALTSINCEVCPYGMYTLHANSTECLQCVSNVVCMGGDQFIVDEGYWRVSLESDVIYSCPNSKACKGGLNYTQEFPVNCTAGYSGFLC